MEGYTWEGKEEEDEVVVRPAAPSNSDEIDMSATVRRRRRKIYSDPLWMKQMKLKTMRWTIENMV